MRMTMESLAARLGISAASVSYALNGQPGVSDETRARVLELARELDFHPSSSARALSRSRSDSIGIILRRSPDLLGSEPYYMKLLSGIEAVLSEAGQSLLFRMDGSPAALDASLYLRWSKERRVDGILLFDHSVDDERPAILTDLGMPFVAHGSLMTDIGGPTFVYDLRTDAELIVSHLHGLGHRSLLQITGSTSYTNESNRVVTMREAARDRGMTMTAVEGNYGLEQAAEVTREHLLGDAPPTAIVTSNDVMALGASAAIAGLGRRDVAVVAYDDSLLCRIAAVPVTALERFTEEQGRKSTHMLLAVIDGRDDFDATAVPSELMVRDSSVRAAG